MPKMPSLFISHGGPNVVIDPSPAHDFLKSLNTLVEKPRAIVIMSAHFETDGVSVVRDEAPGMIYDFGGFARELYEMVYRAPGDQAVADRVIGLLRDAGHSPKAVEKRGYDHGTWNPLILGFPDADIPIVQVSIDPRRDAAYHHRVGAALAPLREEGILLIGSGHITHNLRAVIGLMRGLPLADAALPDKVSNFVDWMRQTLEAGDTQALLAWDSLAPFAADNHPTPDHILPLFFAQGAAGEGASARRVHASVEMKVLAWDSWLFQ